MRHGRATQQGESSLSASNNDGSRSQHDDALPTPTGFAHNNAITLRPYSGARAQGLFEERYTA